MPFKVNVATLCAVAFSGTLVGSCSSVPVDYGALKPGSFRGSLIVMWVGEDKFVFVPDPDNPLTFTRFGGRTPGAVVRPGMMYTDGGSIPKIAQAFNGLSPWGYAPAYMIHDWLFVARHCIKDGRDEPRFNELRDVSFGDSVEIIGEAIRGLIESKQVRSNDTAGELITAAVGTSIAENMWNAEGACSQSLVSSRHAADVAAALPRSSNAGFRSAARLPAAAPVVRSGTPARIVSRVTF